MRTPTVLCLLLSLGVGSAQAQVAASPAGWHVDAATQRERDAARKSILEDELASEARQFVNAHVELRDAGAGRLPSGKVGEIAERLDRHRRNIVELGREVARVEGDVAGAGAPKRAAERLADNWLIPGQGIAPIPFVREPLPARSRVEPGRPEWIIPGRDAGRLQ